MHACIHTVDVSNKLGRVYVMPPDRSNGDGTSVSCQTKYLSNMGSNS